MDIEDRTGHSGYARNVFITAQQHALPADLLQLCPVFLRPGLIWPRLRQPVREDCRAHVLFCVCKQPLPIAHLSHGKLAPNGHADPHLICRLVFGCVHHAVGANRLHQHRRPAGALGDLTQEGPQTIRIVDVALGSRADYDGVRAQRIAPGVGIVLDQAVRTQGTQDPPAARLGRAELNADRRQGGFGLVISTQQPEDARG
jgi:hypothetical protein